MSKNDDANEVWGKILLIVIIIMAFWWWQSDKGRLKWINRLEEQVESYELRIEELENEVEYWKEEAGV